MNVRMTREQFDDLLARDQLQGAPAPGVYYRTDVNLVAKWAPYSETDWLRGEWQHFHVDFTAVEREDKS